VGILACAGSAAHAQTEHWKEYDFAEDGFSITLPDSPKPHTDTTVPDMTVYTVSLAPKTMLTLRVAHLKRDCSSTLGQLRSGASQGKDAIDPKSVRDVAIDGHPGLEYQWKREGGPTIADRFYCVNGRFYSFSMSWPTGQPEPAATKRAIDSFRLLPAMR
jgi:hypothetical protein